MPEAMDPANSTVWRGGHVDVDPHETHSFAHNPENLNPRPPALHPET